MKNWDINTVLETDRIKLRRILSDDFVNLQKIALDKEIWKFHAFYTQINNIKELEEYVNECVHKINTNKELIFSIIDKKTNNIAGNIRLFKSKVNYLFSGTWLGLKYQNSYYNKEAKYLVFNYAFNCLNIHKICFTTDVNNEKSIKSLLKYGSKIVKSEEIKLPNNKIQNTYFFELHKNNWEQIKQNVYKGNIIYSV